MVREQYPDATIANVEKNFDDSGALSCWAQYGSTLTKDPDEDKSDYKSCLLTSVRDFPGGPHFSADGIFICPVPLTVRGTSPPTLLFAEP